MEQHIVKYPIGIQNFEKLRREGYAYVDKTAQVWQLVCQAQYYFLGRPRRFGKSLLLSTIEAYFEGKRMSKKTGSRESEGGAMTKILIILLLLLALFVYAIVRVSARSTDDDIQKKLDEEQARIVQEMEKKGR